MISELIPPSRAEGFWYQSTAPEKTKAVASVGGILHWLAAQNKSAAKGYVYIYDGASAAGTLIAGPLPVEAHGVVSLDCRFGIPFTTGLFVGFSTSDASYSVSGTDDAWWSVGFQKLPGGG